MLYAVSETAEGMAAAFSLAGRDAHPTDPMISSAVGQRPTLLGDPVPVHGEAPTHLALVAGHLLTANYGSGSVTALPVATDGALGRRRRVLQHEGSGPRPRPPAAPARPPGAARPVRAAGCSASTSAPTPCGSTRLDPAAGDAALHGEVRLRPGTGPRHLAFHPRGRPRLRPQRARPDGHRLPLGRGGRRPRTARRDRACCRARHREAATYPSEVVVSPDGRFLWAANRGHDSIAVLALDDTGRRRRSWSPPCRCGGHWPRDLALDPAGRRLYAANERSGDVTWFDVDPTPASRAAAARSTVPAASCVVFG